MSCSQMSIMSKARNLVGVKSGSSSGQVLTLDAPDSSVTFSGPMSLTITRTKTVAMKSIKKSLVKNSSVVVAQWTHDIPSNYEYTVDYNEIIGDDGGCLQITATETTDSGTVATGDDLPCDFAVKSISGTQYIFPPSCEPCGNGVVNTPPSCGTPVPIPVAQGGCVRPRFFNGMFITREDLETQLRYVRVKQRLQNRAMGQGVVWGLPVYLEGPRIRVGSGYAVDCCGNDLTVTCDYKVSVEALMSDPALCGEDAECASLVLEYVECQEQPRPVHGEACGQATPSCEMSRVRETVRLRLKPRCDDEEHTDKLAEAFETLLGIIRPEETTTVQPGGVITTPGVSTVGTTTTWTDDPTSTRPWMIKIIGPQVGSTSVSGALQAPPESPASADPTLWVPFLFIENQPTVLIAVTATPPTLFASIKVDDPNSVVSVMTNVPQAQFTYKPVNGTDPMTNPHKFQIRWETDSPRMRSARLSGEEPAILSVGVVPETELALVTPSAAVSIVNGKTRLTLKLAPFAASPVQPALAKGQYLRVLIMTAQPQATFWAEIMEFGAISPTVVEVIVELREPAPANFTPETHSTRVRANRAPHAVFSLQAVAAETGVTTQPQPAEPVELDCCDDPCCGHGETMDPNDRFVVLVTVLLYAKILQVISELRTKSIKQSGGSLTPANEQALQAAALRLRRSLLSEDIQDTATKREQLDDAVREILSLWCCRAIYNGPSCGCGCGCSEENQGVVIGCAYFQGGEICRVSPLDGRRWVVHQPLLDHWLSTFGYPAVDEQVMRLFSKLCCLGSLPGLSRDVTPGATIGPGGLVAQPQAVMSFSTGGSDTFGLSATPMVSAVMNPIRAVESLAGLSHIDDQRECVTSLVLSLLRLVVSIETISPGALVDNVNRFLCHPLCNLSQRGRDSRTNVRNVAAAGLVGRELRERESQPAMRGAIARLASAIVARTPVSAVAETTAVNKELTRLGFETVPDVVGRDPGSIGTLLSSRDLTRAANKTFRAAEDVPGIVAKGVTASFKALDKEGELTPADWTGEEALASLKKDLKGRLTVSVGGSDKPLLDDQTLTAVLKAWASAESRS